MKKVQIRQDMSKKAKHTKKPQNQDNKRLRLIALISIIVVSVSAAIIFMQTRNSGDPGRWEVDSNGLLSYPGPDARGRVSFEILKDNSTAGHILQTIAFDSKGKRVEAILRIPVSDKKLPGFVLLPGATVPKEATVGLAETVENLGYASIAIDQRNLGVVDTASDFELFKQGKEPVEHMMVYDALLASDILRQDSRIDPDRIVMLGESNGGRFAIAAAAIDNTIYAVVGISTSGYGTGSEQMKIRMIRDPDRYRFYRSIDPDTYIGSISPGKIAMIHRQEDTIIQIDLAEKTFDLAREPKKFYTVNGAGHGYTGDMKTDLEAALKWVFEE